MKITNKLISIIFIIVFIIVFTYYNFDEYRTFHQDIIQTEKSKIELLNKIENFKIEDIKNINNIEFYYTPNKELLTKIIDIINNSKKEIYLETYMLTESRTQEAIIKAHKRWVKIQVILEKSPYMSYNINNKAYENLKKTWIEIVWSNKNNYSLNHSKVLLIDDLSIISTGNYTYSTFTNNRDFFIFTDDKNIRKALYENFLNDFVWKNISIYDDNLIFSPSSSRIKFEKLFESANKDIKIYFQYLLDDSLFDKLVKLKTEKNLEVSIVLPETAIDDENTKKAEKNWIKISIMKKWTMHAKAILIDEKYLYIWSINFSLNSIDNNREIWILCNNNKIINEFLSIFREDSKNDN